VTLQDPARLGVPRWLRITVVHRYCPADPGAVQQLDRDWRLVSDRQCSLCHHRKRQVGLAGMRRQLLQHQFPV